jgi:signal transduction histidine kinase
MTTASGTPTTPDPSPLPSYWNNHRASLVGSLSNAFTQYATDNREELKSARRADYVAAELVDLTGRYLANIASNFDVGATATQLAKQGLAITSGAHLMFVLTQSLHDNVIPTISDPHTARLMLRKLNEFQIIFLEKLGETREVVQLRAQEESQIALQQALFAQLEQQRLLRYSVERRSRSLNQILQLNARLSQANSETELLDEAVSGICQALELEHVTIYEYHLAPAEWRVRTTTASNPALVLPGAPDVQFALQQAEASDDGEFLQLHHKTRTLTTLSIAFILNLSADRRGALIAYSNQVEAESKEELPILMRTFGQGLANLWRNLFLLVETSQRARELEILYGRYIDSIWSNEQAALVAQVDGERLTVQRNVAQPPPLPTNSLPLRIGDQTFGQVALAQEVTLSEEDQEFIQALLREMGTALNNAHLLQTTRAYSNQLQLAAEVSSVATATLDRDALIQQAVELIRARFDYYYVGLFLVDEGRETAVLHAGTGLAGQLQIQQRHHLPLGGGSMIGAAIIRNEAHVAQDVTRAPDFKPNPILPDTRAELALPLRNRGQVIGALTVQSVRLGAFSSEAITVLQNLSDQLAIAIANANLFRQIQANLAETSLLYEMGRQISQARNQGEVYNALIEFARQSEVANLALIVLADDPDYFTFPAFWSLGNRSMSLPGRLPRSSFSFVERLRLNEIVILDEVAARQVSQEVLPNASWAMEQINSLALIPIFIEDQWLGTYVLHSAVPTLDERTLQPFRTLADQAAIILANQHLLRQTELLYQIGRSLSQALTRDDALMIAVQEISAYTGAAQCRVVLYNESAESGVIVAEHVPTRMAGRLRFPMQGDFVYDHLNYQRQPLLLNETDQALPETVRQRYLAQFGAQTSLLLPAASQQELMGFLALDSVSERPFAPNAIIFAQTVVDHLTTQIENLKLLDEALTSAQELIFLNQIQSNISSILNVAELGRIVYQEVSRLLDTSFFLLAEYQHDTREYRPILAVSGGQETAVTPRILLPGEPLHDFLHHHHHHHQLTDKDSPLALAENAPHEAQPQSGLWIPLSHEGAPAGLIAVQSFNPRAYRENDVQLLRSIATQTGLAITNARLFEQIEASVTQLRQLDHMKNQFLANMSHELRTPLNSIIGFSRVMLKGIDGPLTEEQEEDLTSIYNNGQHLLVLINEILDMAKIEAGKMTLSFEPLDIAYAAEASLTTIRSLLPEGVALLADIEADLPIIEADPVRIRQIFINLLSNAAKFTREGAVGLTVRREDAEHLLISISDTGIGIAPEDFDKLFVAFEQVDNSTTRTAGGTGLGLPITQWLVNMHHGKLWLESEEGRGTTFFIRLPIRQPILTTEDIEMGAGKTAVFS